MNKLFKLLSALALAALIFGFTSPLINALADDGCEEDEICTPIEIENELTDTAIGTEARNINANAQTQATNAEVSVDFTYQADGWDVDIYPNEASFTFNNSNYHVYAWACGGAGYGYNDPTWQFYIDGVLVDSFSTTAVHNAIEFTTANGAQVGISISDFPDWVERNVGDIYVGWTSSCTTCVPSENPVEPPAVMEPQPVVRTPSPYVERNRAIKRAMAGANQARCIFPTDFVANDGMDPEHRNFTITNTLSNRVYHWFRLTFNGAVAEEFDNGTCFWLMSGKAENSDTWDIYMVSYNGVVMANLTNTPLVDEFHPQVSLDQKSFVYTGVFKANGNIEAVERNIQTGEVQKVKLGLKRPTYAPDGTPVALDKDGKVVRMDNNSWNGNPVGSLTTVDWSGNTALLNAHNNATLFNIATFQSYELEEDARLYGFNPTGSEAFQLTDGTVRRAAVNGAHVADFTKKIVTIQNTKGGVWGVDQPVGEDLDDDEFVRVVANIRRQAEFMAALQAAQAEIARDAEQPSQVAANVEEIPSEEPAVVASDSPNAFSLNRVDTAEEIGGLATILLVIVYVVWNEIQHQRNLRKRQS